MKKYLQLITLSLLLLVQSNDVFSQVGSVITTKYPIPGNSNDTIVFTTFALCSGNCSNVIVELISNSGATYRIRWQDNLDYFPPDTISNVCDGSYSFFVFRQTPLPQQLITGDLYSRSTPGGLLVVVPDEFKVEPSCNGFCDGALTAFITGGTRPYNVLWSDGQTDSIDFTISVADNLCADSVYTVTITDANDCPASFTTNLTEPAAVEPRASKDDITCFQAADGSASVSPIGGKGGYTFLWQPGGETIPSISNLDVGIYIITVEDSTGCQGIDTVEITQPGRLQINPTVTNIQCGGDGSGFISLNPITGGTEPFTFDWSPNVSDTSELTNLDPGVYSVTVTDSNSCDTSATFTITEPDTLFSNLDVRDVTCFGLNNGSALSIPTSSFPPFRFVWSTGRVVNNATRDSVVNLSPGNYELVVRDANSCFDTINFTINEPPELTGSISKNDVTCNGLSNGSANSSVSGGVEPYTYFWSNGSNDANILNLPANIYNLDIVDANNCTLSLSTEILEPQELTVNVGDQPITCFGRCDGELTADVTGGTQPYDYLWNDVDTAGQVTQSAIDLCVGTYQVLVTDANNCIALDSASIIDPPRIIPAITTTSPLCNGDCNGQAAATATGGFLGYTFRWLTQGGGNLPNNNNPSINTLCAGVTYRLRVTDSENCTRDTLFQLTQPDTISIQSTVNNVTCFNGNDGSIALTIDGGTPNYQVSWNTNPPSTGLNINNLEAGSYTATITDANNCQKDTTIVINEPNPINPNATFTNVNCFNAADGTINTNPTGGNDNNYTYSWLPGGETTPSLTDIPNGTYIVTVRDSENCLGRDTVIITQPDLFGFSLSTINVSCGGEQDGTAQVSNIVGGTAPFTFTWSSNLSDSAVANNFSPGTYSVTVEDANNCDTTIVFQITEPDTLQVNLEGFNIECFGENNGSVVSIPSGGTAPFDFSWSTGQIRNNQLADSIVNLAPGSYSVVVTDDNNCSASEGVTIIESPILEATVSKTDINCFGFDNGTATANPSGGLEPYTYLWSNGQTTQTISNLAPNIYSVDITDANNCTITRTVEILEPTQLTVNAPSQPITCFGRCDGELQVFASGGTLPYTFSWSDTLGQSDSIAIDLCVGDYQIVVTDANGCSASDTASITVPNEIFSRIEVTNLTCFEVCNGIAIADPIGGFAPYTYQWRQGSTNLPGGSNIAVNNLCANTNYTLTITDSENCSKDTVITLTQPDDLSINPSTTNNACFGDCDGVISTNLTGATPPYQITWNNDNNLNTPVIENLCADQYILLVTDENNCTFRDTFNITQPDPLNPNFSFQQATCADSCDAAATIFLLGGSAPYNFVWDNGTVANNVVTSSSNNLCPGGFSVQITDNQSCVDIITFNVPAPQALTADITGVFASCGNICDGSASVSVVGGRPPYSFEWLDGNGVPTGDTTSSIADLCVGDYFVIIRDSAGICSTTESVTILPLVTVQVAVTGGDIDCFGNCNGSAFSFATGGAQPYTYQWSNGSTGNQISNACSGTLTVTATDANGCTASSPSSVTFNEPDEIVINNVNITSASCGNTDDASIEVLASGGTGNLNFTWQTNPPTNGNSLQNVSGGTYDLTISDDNACSLDTSFTLAAPDVISGVPVLTSPICNDNDGELLIDSLSGGTGGYTFLWSDGQTTNPATNLTAGSYFVIITDNSNCSDTIFNINLSDLNGPDLSFTTVDPTCNGDCDGEATVIPTLATPPYSRYFWTDQNGNNLGLNGQTTITNRCAGDYTVEVADSDGCTSFGTVIIDNPLPITVDPTVIDETCEGFADGQISVIPSGGSGSGYTYSWNNSQTSSSISNLSEGPYSVTVSDGLSCSETFNFNIEVANSINLTSNIINLTCNDADNGAIILNASGPYRYVWTPNVSSSNAAIDLAAATYSVQVIDTINNCTLSESYTVNEPDVIDFTLTSNNIQCFGSSTGSAAISNLSGGSGNYNFRWLPGLQTTQSVSNLSATNYTVRVIDANAPSCFVERTFTINQPQPIVINNVTSQDLTCFENETGFASVSASGGTGNLTYTWSPGGMTGPIQSDLAEGSYTVTVSDQNSCSVDSTIVISQPNNLSYNEVISNVSCNSESDGSIALNPSGGSAPYNYNWTNIPSAGNVSTVSNLTEGSYNVIVTDANGCNYNNTFNVTEPSPIVVGDTVVDFATCGVCDGSITLQNVSGSGGGPYNYVWNGINQFGSTAINLCAALYSVTITDLSNNCSSTINIGMSDLNAPLVTANVLQNVSCNGGNDGAASVSPQGVNPPFQYLWTPSGITDSIAANLVADTYFVSVEDSLGCITLETITIFEPSSLDLDINVSNASCSGVCDGSISINPIGGTGPFSYSWSNGAGNQNSISNLCADTYTVTITDANTCITSETIVVGQPNLLQFAKDSTNVTCVGDVNGFARVNISGGASPYFVEWSNGNTATVNTTSAINNLAVGLYTAIVTDQNGCSDSVSFNITSRPPILTNVQNVQASCGNICDGSAAVLVSGGVAPYSFNWFDMNNNALGITDSVATNLCEGEYYVVVSDSGGLCQTVANVTISPLVVVTVNATGGNISCFGDCNGSATSLALGGAEPYTYVWNTGATGQSVSGLCEGTYEVTATDANGCVNTTNATVVFTNPAEIQIDSVIIIPASCNNQNNGEINLSASGGSGNLVYSWSTSPTSTTASISNLFGGVYDLSISDDNGCQLDTSFTVPAPASITATPDLTSPQCGINDGQINLTNLNGGTAPYTFLWNDGATINPRDSLFSGAYWVAITDSEGCSDTLFNINLSDDGAPTVSFDLISPTCNGDCDGEITAIPTGGTPPYSNFVWTDNLGATISNPTPDFINNLCEGDYTVELEDSLQCKTFTTANLTAPDTISVSANITNETCGGFNDGAISVTPSGGTAPYTYSWSGGLGNNNSVANLSEGTYTVTVTDALLCSNTFTFDIEIETIFNVNISSSNVTCNNGSNGFIVINAPGPNAFVWTPNVSSGVSASNLSANIYSVEIIDTTNSCSTTEVIEITQPNQISVSIATVNNTCFGEANGSATITNISGGSGSYNVLWLPSLQTGNSISNLAANTYTLRVFDANDANCFVDEVFTIGQGPEIEINNIIVSDLTCNGNNTGAVSASASGGVGILTYTWLPNNLIGQNQSNLAAGNYSLRVRDGNNCFTDTLIVIEEPGVISLQDSINNVTCFGDDNGSIFLTVNGGTAPFSFDWGATLPDAPSILDLEAGTYSVNITDSNNCSGNGTFTILEPNTVVATDSVIASTCGVCDGSIFITNVVGGNGAPYNFDWIGENNTTNNITNICAGTYEVLVTDSLNCSQQLSFNMSDINSPPLDIEIRDVTCFGLSDGFIRVTPTTNNPPFTFDWNIAVGNVDSVTNLSAGTYTVEVTDSSGCSTFESITIAEPNPLNIDFNVTPLSCASNCDAVIDAQINGGTAPFTFSWNNNLPDTNLLTNLCADTYSLEVTDANNCITASSTTIVPATQFSITKDSLNISCFGEDDGFARVTISGGTAPYQVNWSNGISESVNSTSIINDLPPNVYQAIIEDAAGCIDSVSFNIEQPLELLSSVQNVSGACSNTCNGAATVFVFGGRLPYSFEWLDENNNPIGVNTATANNLCIGEYTVIISDSGNNCSTTATVLIEPIIAVNISTLGGEIDCFGNCNATASAVAVGGVGPYTYTWSNGFVENNVAASTNNSLCAGNFTVLVTDANGCQSSGLDGSQFDNPDQIFIDNANITPASCGNTNDGAIELLASGGTDTLFYVWSTSPISSSQNIFNLNGGTYNLTITDANNCELDTSFVVPSPADITATVVLTSPQCGVNDGEISLNTITGGTAPYTFEWNDGATANPRDSLFAGTYWVAISDAEGCSDTIFNINLNDDGAPNVSLDILNSTCNGDCDGEITAIPTGGNPPYVSFTWSDNLGNVITTHTPEILSGLCEGDYTVQVIDSVGCVANATGNVVDPDTISIVATVINETCDGFEDGSISLTALGGTAPYSFAWASGQIGNSLDSLSAGTYTVTVTDSLGCSNTFNIDVETGFDINYNVSVTNVNCAGDSTGQILINAIGGPYQFNWTPNVSNTFSASNLIAGDYGVEISDANTGCSIIDTITVSEQNTLSAVVTTVDVTCFGDNTGSATIDSLSGGSGNYDILWLPSLQTTNPISNLSQGTYSVRIIDANNANCFVEIPYTINQAPQIVIDTILVQNLTCNNNASGALQAVVAGGTGNLNYSWSPGNLSGQVQSNLSSGTYTLTVTDDNNCSAQSSATITQPDALAIDDSVIDVSCNGLSDGSIILNVTGGTGAYSFDWGTNFPSNNTNTLTGILAGTYTVIVSDANNCAESININVNEPTEITATANISDAACGVCDGEVLLSNIQGSNGGPYTYLWSNNAVTDSIGGLCAGIYSVTITDTSNNCSSSFTYNVGNVGAPQITLIDLQNVSCNGLSDGSIQVSVSGDNPPFSIEWLNSSVTDSLLENLSAGTYTIEVTDADSCVSIETYTISQPDTIQINFDIVNTSCNALCDGELTANVIGGTAPFTFSWGSIGSTTPNVGNLCEGTYTVNVTDSNNCAATDSAAIIQPSEISATFDIVEPTCNDANGSVVVLPSGGNGSPYTYVWGDGTTASTLTGIDAGVYSVTVTDSSGLCSEIFSVPVNNANTFTVNESITNVNCTDPNAGEISLNIFGGQAPYIINWLQLTSDSSTVSNLSAGIYDVVIIDADSCQGFFTYQVINTSTPLQANITSTQALCGECDGSATVNATGDSPFTYLWNNGATTSTINNLCAGIYSVLVEDSLGCGETFDVTINNIGGPTGVSFDLTNVSCNGLNDGAITNFQAIGGTAPYNYQLLPTLTNTNLAAGTYNLEVQDANNCIWIENIDLTEPDAFVFDQQIVDAQCGVNDGSITISNVSGGSGAYTFTWQGGLGNNLQLQNLAAGVYVLNIDDGNCNSDFSFIVNTPSDHDLTISTTDVSCFGFTDGEASLVINGGSGNFTINWSNGVNNQNSIDNLLPGNYFVTVIDDSSLCQITESFDILEPNVLASTLPVVSSVSCAGDCNGTASLQPLGGTAPYTFVWQNGETTNPAVNLCEGQSNFTITDANNCTYQGTVDVQSPLPLSLDTLLTPPNCPDSPDGKIELLVAGGTSPFTYQWQGPSNSNTNTVSNALAGDYTVTVVDANGCQETISIDLIPNNPIPTIVSGDTSYCFGDGPAEISGLGGDTFQWQDEQGNIISSNQSSLIVDPEIGESLYIYAAFVGSCVIYDTVIVTVNPIPLADAGNNISGFVETSVVLGGTPTSDAGNTVVWTPGGQLDDSTAFNPNLVINETETYIVNVTDPIGCTNSDTVIVEALSRISYANGITPNGDGKNDVWIIDNIELFPNALVEIYNRWGDLLFTSVGYATPWDGKYNNQQLPVGTYYYVIDLRDDRFKPLTGPITIMR